jgi:hypothetical protein
MAYKQNVNVSAYRMLFPFFLIIAVVLLLVWRLIVSPGLSPPAACPHKTKGYWVQPGDSCWDISQAHGCSLDTLRELNPQVDCALLTPGTTVCLPEPPLSS